VATLADFWALVNKRGRPHPTLGRCWDFSGGPPRRGGALFTSRNDWELHFGDLPPGARVRRRCHNGRCVNPAHLCLAAPFAPSGPHADEEEAAFLEAICAEPGEAEHRAAYADWLEEHGQPERAALVRPARP
jgi:uncharacterized protein (TIGR02996 family)